MSTQATIYNTELTSIETQITAIETALPGIIDFKSYAVTTSMGPMRSNHDYGSVMDRYMLLLRRKTELNLMICSISGTNVNTAAGAFRPA